MSIEALQVADDTYLIFGLRWVVLDSLESAGEQLNNERAKGAAYSVTYNNGVDKNVGFINEFPDNIERLYRSKNKLLAGAAQIAAHPSIKDRNAVLVTIEEPGVSPDPSVVAVVGIINNAIVLDEILQPEYVSAKREWFFKECQRRNISHYDTVGTVFSIEKTDKPMTWRDVAEVRSGGILGKTFRITKLENQLDPRIWKTLLIVTLLSAIIMSALYAWTWYQEEEEKKRVAEAAKAAQVDYPMLYAKSLASELQKPVWNIWQLPSLQSEVSSMIPRSIRAGWAIAQVECVAASENCVYKWKRIAGLGTNASFRDSAPVGKINYAAADEILQTVELLEAPEQRAEEGYWLSPTAYEVDVRSEWTKWVDRGVHFTYDAKPKFFAVPQGMTDQHMASVPAKVRFISWKLEGEAWERDALKNMPRSSTIDTVTWLFDKTSTNTTDLPALKIAVAGKTLMQRDNYVPVAPPQQ